MNTIWEGLNSPLALMAIGAIVTWALGLLYRHRPGWKQYQAAVIAAIRLAEDTIPDDTGNRAPYVVDQALRYVLRVHEAAKKREATPAEIAALTAVVQTAVSKTHG